jgi:hypothetical protein
LKKHEGSNILPVSAATLTREPSAATLSSTCMHRGIMSARKGKKKRKQGGKQVQIL